MVVGVRLLTAGKTNATLRLADYAGRPMAAVEPPVKRLYEAHDKIAAALAETNDCHVDPNEPHDVGLFIAHRKS